MYLSRCHNNPEGNMFLSRCHSNSEVSMYSHFFSTSEVWVELSKQLQTLNIISNIENISEILPGVYQELTPT